MSTQQFTNLVGTDSLVCSCLLKAADRIYGDGSRPVRSVYLDLLEELPHLSGTSPGLVHTWCTPGTWGAHLEGLLGLGGTR